MSPQLSLIVPALDKAGLIAATLDALASLRACGHETTAHPGSAAAPSNAHHNTQRAPR